jgi:hypothetical protein
MSITMLCYYAECLILFTNMLNVVMVSVVMLSVIILSVVLLNVIIMSVVMLNVIILIDVMLNVIILIDVMLNVVILSVIAPLQAFPETQSYVCDQGQSLPFSCSSLG